MARPFATTTGGLKERAKATTRGLISYGVVPFRRVFQIIGNKHMVLASIQHPICSAAQPADVMQRFIRAWEEEKSSDDYKKRMQISERLTKERRALKNAAHAARQALVRGKIEKNQRTKNKNSREAKRFTRTSSGAPSIVPR